MLAPGGFDATIEKWLKASAWTQINALEALSSKHTIVAYDRRESGRSGGRVDRLSWGLYARQGRTLLDHLKIDSAFVMGGCMGCSVALAFATRYPKATRGLILHWPVGGYRWKINGRERLLRHLNFAREKGFQGVIDRARQGKNFWQESEGGPWASVIARDPGFAEVFGSQDLDRYLGIVAASRRILFDRDTAPGAETEEVMSIKAPSRIIPGDDASHATSAAHYLRECLPKPEFWNVMPPDQTTQRNCERILDFCSTHG
jgi:pimeloyl-ACP methyl ester carboxylesterase